MRDRTLVAPALFLVGTLTVLSIVAVFSMSDSRHMIATWIVVASVVAAPVAIRVVQEHPNGLDLFEPIIFASLVYGVLFVVPYGIVSFTGYGYPPLPAVDLGRGAGALVVGVLAFAVGYFCILPVPLRWRRVPDPNQLRWSGRAILSAVVVGSCVISLATYVLFWFPLAGGIAAYLNPGGGFVGNVQIFRGTGMARAASVCASVGFFLACAHLVLRKRVYPIDVGLVAGAALISIAATALTKERVFLLWNVGIPVLILHYCRRPIRAIEASFGIIGLFIVAVLFTVLLRSPTALNTEPGTGPLMSIARFMVGQSGEFFVVSDIVERQPQVLPFLYGSTLTATVVNVVPRSIWPDKPPTAGEIYTRDFFPAVWDAGATFLGVPWLGELYLNGGAAALAAGGVLSGAFFASAYRYLMQRSSALARVLLGVLAFSLFLLLTRGSLQFYSLSLVWGVPLVAGWLVLTSQRLHAAIERLRSNAAMYRARVF